MPMIFSSKGSGDRNKQGHYFRPIQFSTYFTYSIVLLLHFTHKNKLVNPKLFNIFSFLQSTYLRLYIAIRLELTECFYLPRKNGRVIFAWMAIFNFLHIFCRIKYLRNSISEECNLYWKHPSMQYTFFSNFAMISPFINLMA